jgi:hypothetical protein
LRPSAGKLGDGLDIRSEDSYVLLPPSVINGVAYTIINPAPPAPLPAWISEKLDKPRHEPVAAPEGVVVDPEGSEAWAITLIEATITHDGPALVGNSLNERTYALAARLRDGPQYGYSISEDAAVALVLTHWSSADRVEDTVRNAYRSAENTPGCGQANSASRAYDPQLGVRPYDPEPPQTERPEQDIPPEPARPAVDLLRGSSVTMRQVEWLWPGWLAAGKFHILAGEGGAGKSTISFSLLAQVTRGGKWPDGSPAPLGDVLIWSGEDDIADTILPRIVAAGGDPDRVYFPLDLPGRRAFDPSTDMPALRERVRLLPSLKVVLIDSIVSSVGGDSHNNAETRRGLQPVVDFATDTGAAVLGITHFTKGTQGKNPIERITGSLAFAALARVAWGASVGDDPGAPRKLVRVKNNIEQNGGGFEFTLLQDRVRGHEFTAQRVAWGSAIEGSAQALLQGGEGSKEAQAIRLLESLLQPAGTAGILRNDLKVHAEDAGLSWATMERAKGKIGVESFKGLGSNQAPWYWRLLPSDGV